MATTVRVQKKTILTIPVATDCVKFYTKDYPGHERMREITCKHIANGIIRNNPAWKNSLLEVHYDPIKHCFDVREILPYLADDEDMFIPSNIIDQILAAV